MDSLEVILENRPGIKNKEDQINCILYQFYNTYDESISLFMSSSLSDGLDSLANFRGTYILFVCSLFLNNI